jgi:hypothetical protein
VNNWDQIYGDLKKRGWVIFMILAAAGYFFMSRSFTMGIILGGILIIVNFNFLQSTIIKAFQQNSVIKRKKFLLLSGSFLRLFLLGGIIFALIKFNIADPIGLAVGLSVIFFSILSMGISSAWKSRNGRVF